MPQVKGLDGDVLEGFLPLATRARAMFGWYGVSCDGEVVLIIRDGLVCQ